MMRNMRRGIPNLFKAGTSHLSGVEEAVIRNLKACKQLTEMTRTSLGPQGMNKLIINHIGKVFVTSDTATLMRELEVDHPAARMITLAAAMQEQEMGDGSNLVVILAGELLAMAEELIYMGLHPSDIITGFNKAGQKAIELLEELVIFKLEEKDLFTKEGLVRGITACISSKQHGYEKQLSSLVAEACLTVMPKNTYNFNVDNIRVCKLLGGDITSSYVVKGMVFTYPPIGTIRNVTEARIAVFTCAIDAADTETKGVVLIKTASELTNFNNSEEKEIEKLIKAVKDSGVNVVVTGGTVSDMAAHFLEKYGLMCLRVGSKFELRRLCQAVKARPLLSLGGVSPEFQGYCSAVNVREVGLTKITVFEQDSKDDTAVATIVLRASTFNTLNDVERAIDDGVNTIKAMGKERCGRFLAGAGGVEIELAKRLRVYGNSIAGLEQYSIHKFAEALEVIPRTLAENAGQEATSIISALYASHDKGDLTSGIDVENGVVKDMTALNILDLLPVKKQALKLALDATLTILRVDQIIQAKPAGGPKAPKNDTNWDDTDGGF